MEMLKPEDVKVLDMNSEYLGVPTEALMRNAGEAVARLIVERFGEKKNVLFFCGPGNNGGDGFTAARFLLKKENVRIVLVVPPEKIKTPLARRAYEEVKEYVEVIGGADEVVSAITWADVIVDAMLGVGIRGQLREPYDMVCRLINSSEKPVVSVDVPTGLGTEDAVLPDITVTFHDVKEGMTPENSGEIVVADIGIPEEAWTCTGPGLFVFYPRNPSESHKGENGHLLIIGGGPYTGAPALAALAAYRVGVDLVTVAAPEKAADVIASFSPSIIPLRLSGTALSPEHVDVLLEYAGKASAVLIGPGLGRAKETRDAVEEFMSRVGEGVDVPIVVDADGLALLKGKAEMLKGKNVVITPHEREFRDLFAGQNIRKKKRKEKALEGARIIEGVVLLKGVEDVIASHDGRVLLNRTGNPAMTVGGTGDVLAGLVGGLLAKGMEPFHSASLAAFINGYAGDIVFGEKVYGLMPMDLVENIPHVLKKFL